MQPENQPNHFNPDHLPNIDNSGVEKRIISDSTELGVESGAEPYEKKSEINAIMADVNLTTVLPAPVSTYPVSQPDDSLSGNPITANDDDLIEKEWVDRAKKIVEATQNDPHQQDKEVNKLQVDYIKKRFGRELGVAE